MNYIKVQLWGEELGRLVWDSSRRVTYFLFNPDAQTRPDVAPLLHPVNKWDASMPSYGDTRRIYQGLPPFIADSLPDSWGNKVFDQWVRRNHINRNKITPLDKLLFIGRRGMGALEFEPAAQELEHPYAVGIDSLYRLSLDVLEDRESMILTDDDNITLSALMAAGSSAGGRQMKAILAINPVTGEIRSGQIGGLKDFDYALVKFEDPVVPTSEIEMAYYEMVVASGISIEECRLMKVEGTSHFMTRCFDRKKGERIHIQTLAAINPEADSYEELFATCRRLQLGEKDITELYRRMVFNVMANNTDDHNKNFTFMLEQGGKWHLTPAYDMTFIFNVHGTGPQKERCLTLYGKDKDITKADLLEFAGYHSIADADRIIDRVAGALVGFTELAKKYAISSRWSHIIEKTLRNNLISFGYLVPQQMSSEITGTTGSLYRKLSVSVNSRGIYEVRAEVDGQNIRRFVKEGSDCYADLQKFELGRLDAEQTVALLDQLFRNSG